MEAYMSKRLNLNLNDGAESHLQELVAAGGGKTATAIIQEALAAYNQRPRPAADYHDWKDLYDKPEIVDQDLHDFLILAERLCATSANIENENQLSERFAFLLRSYGSIGTTTDEQGKLRVNKAGLQRIRTALEGLRFLVEEADQFERVAENEDYGTLRTFLNLNKIALSDEEA